MCTGYLRLTCFHGWRHPKEMGARDVKALQGGLTLDRHVAASTQNQTLAALLFLYKVVLEWICRGWRGSSGPSGHDGCRRF